MLYSGFMPKKKLEERLKMPCVPRPSLSSPSRTVLTPRLVAHTHRLSTLVETVSKKPIPDHVRDIVFELMVNDIESGDDVEVPYLKVRVR